MSVVKATAITNRDATPVVLNNPKLQDGEKRTSVGVVAVGATDASGTIYKFGSIPSNARVSALKLSTDAAGGAFVGKLGLFDVSAVNSGAVISGGDEFGTGIDLHTAAVTNSDQKFHAGATALTVANAEKAVWELLGLASDPCKTYDIGMTCTTSNTTTGFNAALEMEYVL